MSGKVAKTLRGTNCLHVCMFVTTSNTFLISHLIYLQYKTLIIAALNILSLQTLKSAYKMPKVCVWLLKSPIKKDKRI